MNTKMMLTGLGLALALAAKTSLAVDSGGKVYLGCNYAKSVMEYFATIAIDELPPVSFDRPYRGARLIASGLDISRSHRVRTYFEGKVVDSWEFSFSRLKTARVGIWHSAGNWHTDPMPLRGCPA